MAAFAVAECIEVQNHEVQIQVDLKLAARMRFCARETALKWHFRVLRDMQHLTWQTNQGYVRNTQEICMLEFTCLSHVIKRKSKQLLINIGHCERIVQLLPLFHGRHRHG